jgi:hypothetical protein
VHYPDPSIFYKNQVSFVYQPGEEHRYAIADEFRRHKVICRPGTQNDIAAGLARVKEYLKFDPSHPHAFHRDENGNPLIGAPRMFFTKDCVCTINEFDLYRWPKDKRGILDRSSYEVPIKENDHAMDAIKYIILSMTAPLSEDERSSVLPRTPAGFMRALEMRETDLVADQEY